MLFRSVSQSRYRQSGSLFVPSLKSWQANNTHANIFGYIRGDVNYKLLHMLNYGNIIPNDMQAPLDESSQTYTQIFKYDLAVNLFPLAAYQKIYQDFFRWSQWESADPTSYNFDWYSGSGNVFGSDVATVIPASNDYWKRDNLVSLRYCNWNKDMFMGILPNSQFGDIAVVDVSVDGSSPVYIGNTNNTVQNFSEIKSDSSFLLKPSSAHSIVTGKQIGRAHV